MNPTRFDDITARYPQLRIAVVGDFCLDRYLEIDPARQETSLETGLPVHNVVNVRAQPGGAGTILNNLAALGIGELLPVGFCGDDGEGFELRRALQGLGRSVSLEYFFYSSERRTFTYCKPLVMPFGRPPVELNRLDSKNWTPTPALMQGKLQQAISALADQINAFILLDQVDVPETGAITSGVLETLRAVVESRPKRLILADSRRSLRGYPPVCFKMNAAELSALVGARTQLSLGEVKRAAAALAARQGRPVFVTLAELGLLGAAPDGEMEYVPALPLRGEIDIVGAGDAVSANLAAALAAGATMREALEIANAAASIVIHQLGTTGAASPDQIRRLLESAP
jgi:rfaE bifunctional protein kinase chain/domain